MSASVFGIITNEGFFEGTIFTPAEEFHIEHINRYFPTLKQSPNFHSIIYKLSDVRDPRMSVSCASDTLHRKRSKRWLLEAEAKLPYDDSNFWNPNRTRLLFSPPFDLNQPIDEELELGNRTNVDVSGLLFRNVNKRALIDPKKTTCMLYLQADHQFFQKYGTEEACIEVMTRHVQRVNGIYKATGKIFLNSIQ